MPTNEDEPAEPTEPTVAPDTTRHSVAGGWLGKYHYLVGGIPPTRFEATLTRAVGATNGRSARFRGVILDDGPLGEARVTGGVRTGRRVCFTKVYLRQSEALGNTFRVCYEGTLSEDGRALRGEWRLSHRLPCNKRPVVECGTWEARRLWSEKAAPEAVLEGAGEAVAV